MPPKTAAPAVITIPALNIQRMLLKIVGDSSLIVHAWSEKARRQMLDAQMKKARAKKEAKDPWVDFCDSMYWLTEKPAKPTAQDVEAAKFGFPVIAFKAAAVDACSHVEGITKVLARGAFHIDGEFVEIHGDGPHMREDMVRVGMGTADIRHRGEWHDWHAVLPVKYNANVLSPEQIVHLFNTAGFAIGVGEWRPSRDGMNGRFHVGDRVD